MSQPVTIKSHAGFGAETSELPPEDALMIRPSSYANYALCGYRELLRDQPGYEPGSNVAPGKGTGMHAGINHFLETGDILARDEVLPMWAKEMQDRGEDLYAYASEGLLNELATDIHHGLLVWYNTFWLPYGSEQETLAYEERILRGLGVLPNGREVWVSGQADRVVPSEVQDWKTSGSGWKPAKAYENVVQIATYSWLVEHLTDATRGAFVVYDWSKRTWSWAETTLMLTPETKQAALLSLWDMAVTLDAGHTVATPHSRGSFGAGRGWHCTPKFCPAWAPCPFKGLIPDGRGSEVKTSPINWDTE